MNEIPEPNACAVCDRAQLDHGRRYSTLVGWHTWFEPTDDQRLHRMKARRAQRVRSSTLLEIKFSPEFIGAVNAVFVSFNQAMIDIGESYRRAVEQSRMNRDRRL